MGTPLDLNAWDPWKHKTEGEGWQASENLPSPRAAEFFVPSKGFQYIKKGRF
jgi:hypothetical protein